MREEFEVLISEEELDKRISEMAEQLDKEYEGKTVA